MMMVAAAVIYFADLQIKCNDFVDGTRAYIITFLMRYEINFRENTMLLFDMLTKYLCVCVCELSNINRKQYLFKYTAVWQRQRS